MANKYYIPKCFAKRSEAVAQMCSLKKVFLKILHD